MTNPICGLKGRAILAIAASVLFMAPLPTAAQAAETVTIATSTETMDAFVPQFGSEVGIFDKHGLQLDYFKGARGPAMVAAVVGGSADITHVGAALIFPAIEKGATLTVLTGNYDIDYTFIARKDAGVDLSKGYPEFLTALKGKLIGVAGRGGGAGSAPGHCHTTPTARTPAPAAGRRGAALGAPGTDRRRRALLRRVPPRPLVRP